MASKIMQFLKNRSKKQKIVLLILLPFAAYLLLLGIAKCYAAWVMPLMPSCLLRSLTGHRCPSCGMTHSVFALTRLDLLAALKENAAIPFFVLLGLLRYAELWCGVLGRPRVLIPRKLWFWISVIAVFLLYAVLREL